MIDYNCIFTEKVECAARKTFRLPTEKLKWFDGLADSMNTVERFTHSVCRLCPKLRREI